ncbi:MAG: hypothetical protein NC120_09545 [Ruminococcus sp.]|nr:hypothetical protein [Ruminococcus sp.]
MTVEKSDRSKRCKAKVSPAFSKAAEVKGSALGCRRAEVPFNGVRRV